MFLLVAARQGCSQPRAPGDSNRRSGTYRAQRRSPAADWWGEDHHMWKLGSVKRDGGLDATLLVLKRAAHQPIRICDKIGVDIVENQGRYVSWLAQIVWSIHCEELAGRKTIFQFPALPRWYTQRARHTGQRK